MWSPLPRAAALYGLLFRFVALFVAVEFVHALGEFTGERVR